MTAIPQNGREVDEVLQTKLDSFRVIQPPRAARPACLIFCECSKDRGYEIVLDKALQIHHVADSIQTVSLKQASGPKKTFCSTAETGTYFGSVLANQSTS